MQLTILSITSNVNFGRFVALGVTLLIFLYMRNRLNFLESNIQEDDRREDEDFIRSLGITPQYNYLVADKGWRPFFYNGGGGNAFYRGFVLKRYLLVFTDSELILRNDESSKSDTIRLKYNDIENFKIQNPSQNNGTLKKYTLFGNSCISFKYKSKKYYFYFNTADKEYTNYLNVNYQTLLSKNFNGLLQ